MGYRAIAVATEKISQASPTPYISDGGFYSPNNRLISL